MSELYTKFHNFLVRKKNREAKTSDIRVKSLCFLAALLTALNLCGQENPTGKDKGLLFRISYAYHLPGGDMADRFGSNFSLGGGLDFLTSGNWLIGVEGQFLFGSQVNTDVLTTLRTPEGNIYGNDKSIARIRLGERGFYAGIHSGKVFGLSKANPRSGLRLTLGGGLMQHKIRIQDDPVSLVPQLSGAYKKGYDRLSNGFALQEFVGYQLLSTDGLLNFYIGLEFVQAFTQNRRSFNFDTQAKEAEKRTDLLFGLRAAWILPFYFRKADEIYY